MSTARVQFAVVREDPRIEREVLTQLPRSRGLIIGSGGCTALALASWYPELELTLLDPNPHQLERIAEKIFALTSADRDRCFNLGNSDPSGLSQSGNFEGLFRGLRHFICNLVVSEEAVELAFVSEEGPVQLLEQLQSSPYWPVAFELYFSDTLLRTMFGEGAIQYAEYGSYPAYFQAVFERGLRCRNAHINPFLHHIFLGRYLETCPPDFLRDPPTDPLFEMIHGDLSAVRDLRAYDFIGLSNILDWMPPSEIDNLLMRLREETMPGTVVVWRQLNNKQDIAAQLADVFSFRSDLEQRLHEADRSLFYSSLHIGERTHDS
jgi:S-adenosylmethionine-diacylglycerol 3-amino-3-carboxypropyl transferase